MRFNISKERLLKPLQIVSGAVERRHTLAILGNVLVTGDVDGLTLTGTDMELELVARVATTVEAPGEVTVPARKMTDICRALPPEAEVDFAVKEDRVTIRSGRSRFSLGTLPARDFPNLEGIVESRSLSLEGARLKLVLDRTLFAMAQQDVRYYLNGLLLETGGGRLRAVATDGHRLALCETELVGEEGSEIEQIIIPRKGVLELARLLGEVSGDVRMGVGSQSCRVSAGEVRLASKLVEGRFPDYQRVVPDPDQCERRMLADRDALRQSLVRVSILSNDKYRAVRLGFEDGVLRILAHNPEQEEAEEEVEVEYIGDPLEVGFNVSYLIDALGAIESDRVEFHLMDGNSSCLIRGVGETYCRYVVMPMRL
jgi:DNA polymerase-3 subunit beta